MTISAEDAAICATYLSEAVKLEAKYPGHDHNIVVDHLKWRWLISNLGIDQCETIVKLLGLKNPEYKGLGELIIDELRKEEQL